jgi:hypothetical protein
VDCHGLERSGVLHVYDTTLAARIAAFEADPPPAAWTGVFVAGTKSRRARQWRLARLRYRPRVGRMRKP